MRGRTDCSHELAVRPESLKEYEAEMWSTPGSSTGRKPLILAPPAESLRPGQSLCQDRLYGQLSVWPGRGCRCRKHRFDIQRRVVG